MAKLAKNKNSTSRMFDEAGIKITLSSSRHQIHRKRKAITHLQIFKRALSAKKSAQR